MKSLIITLFLISSPPLWANINTFPNNKFHLHTGFLIPGYDIQFQNDNNRILKIAPNINSQIGIGGSISDLFGVSWGFATSQTDKNIVDKGRTEYIDFRFNFAFKKFIISSNYSDFEGLFVDRGQAPFTRYNNMTLRNISINVVYVLNPKRFSTAAMYDQTERQEVSGGTWLIASSLEESYFNNRGQTFLTGQSIDFGSDQNMTAAKFRTLNFSAGGGYTFSFKKAYYISGTSLFGIGIQQSQVDLVNRKYNALESSTKFTINIAAGYNGNRFFSGLGLFATGTRNKTDNIEISNNMYNSRLFIGVHL